MAISNRAPTSAFLRCAALRGSLFEVNATLFSAPRIPDPPLFRQGILPPASAQRQRIRPRIPREFVSPESTLFLSPSLVRREVRGASFHPSFFLISFFTLIRNWYDDQLWSMLSQDLTLKILSRWVSNMAVNKGECNWLKIL